MTGFGRLRWLSQWSKPLVLGALLPACGAADRAFPDPVTDDGGRLISLWWGSSMAALAVAVLVWGLIALVVVLGYRRRRARAGLPSQSAANVPLEVLYTAVPLVIVAVLFAFSFDVQRQVTGTEGEPDLRVEVVGFQWQWQFRYPAEGVTVTGTYEDPPELVLPVGQRVRLRLVTTDVIHSFWVPQFLTKRDLIPGVENEIDLTVDEAGTWTGRCAEYCGLDHYRMNFEVRAVPPHRYRLWIAEKQDALEESRQP